MVWPVPLPDPTGDEEADLAAFAVWEEARERHYYPERFGSDGERLPKPREFTYYVGVPEPSWLNKNDGVPKFVSAARFDRYRSEGERWPVTTCDPYAIDSGAYIALNNDNYSVPWWQHPETYASKILTYVTNSGYPPEFCAPQDMPCEPNVRKRTGLTTREHQEITRDNYLFLVREWPWIPWIPVLQGWEPGEHVEHATMYEDAGVDLAAAIRVGVGSICRRGHLPEIVEVIEQLAGRGYQLHGFGIKATALPVIGHHLRSADSMAWSFDARYSKIRLPGCTHGGDNCANCYRYAVRWRERVLASLPKREEVAVAATALDQVYVVNLQVGDVVDHPERGRLTVKTKPTVASSGRPVMSRVAVEEGPPFEWDAFKGGPLTLLSSASRRFGVRRTDDEHEPGCILDPGHHFKDACVVGSAAAPESAPAGSTILCPLTGCGRQAKIRRDGRIGAHYIYGRQTCRMVGQEPPPGVKVLHHPEQLDLFAGMAEFAAMVSKDLGLVAAADPSGPQTIPLADAQWGMYGQVDGGYGPDGSHRRKPVRGYILTPPRIYTSGMGEKHNLHKGVPLLSFTLFDPSPKGERGGSQTYLRARPDAVFTLLDPPADRPLEMPKMLSRRMSVADMRRGDVFYIWDEPGLHWDPVTKTNTDTRPRYHVQVDPMPAGDDGGYEVSAAVDGRPVTKMLHGELYVDVQDPEKTPWQAVEPAVYEYGDAGQVRVADLPAPSVFRTEQGGQPMHLYYSPKPGLFNQCEVKVLVDGVLQTRKLAADMLVELVPESQWRWQPGHFVHGPDARVKVFTADHPDKGLPVAGVRLDGVLARPGGGKDTATRLVGYAEVTGREVYGIRLMSPSPVHISPPALYPGWPGGKATGPLPDPHPFTATFPGGRRCAVCLLSSDADCHPVDGPVNAGPVLDELLAVVTRPGQTRNGAHLAQELADRYAAGIPLVRRDRKLNTGLTYVCPVPGCGGMKFGWHTVRSIRKAWLEHAAGHDGFTGTWPDEQWPAEPDAEFIMPKPGKGSRRAVVEVVNEIKDDPWWDALLARFSAEGRVTNSGPQIVAIVFDEGANAARQLRKVLVQGGFPTAFVTVYVDTQRGSTTEPFGPLAGLPMPAPAQPGKPAFLLNFERVPATTAWWQVAIAVWTEAGLYQAVREPDKAVSLLIDGQRWDWDQVRTYLAAVCERGGVPNSSRGNFAGVYQMIAPATGTYHGDTYADIEEPEQPEAMPAAPLFDLESLGRAVDAALTTQ